jgi:hypothetical protein
MGFKMYFTVEVTKMDRRKSKGLGNCRSIANDNFFVVSNAITRKTNE